MLDSDGGSVHGAIALGREIRKLKLDTTVGRAIDLAGKRAGVAPRANCESMCAFVLVGGVHRTVPAQARVMVHQIWLGDRREDPTAASYSAEDLVLVQRDIGRLVRYTADMGASMELVDLALRIPPWEPMHVMTRDEMRTARVETLSPGGEVTATVAAAPAEPPRRACCRTSPTARAPSPSASSAGPWSTAPATWRWRAAIRSPSAASRSAASIWWWPAAATTTYDVSYIEHRRAGSTDAAAVAAGRRDRGLQRRRRAAEGGVVAAPQRSGRARHLCLGRGAGQADRRLRVLRRPFADDHHAQRARLSTAIRLGNTGAQENLPKLAAACREGLGDRAALQQPRTGGLASAK